MRPPGQRGAGAHGGQGEARVGREPGEEKAKERPYCCLQLPNERV